MTWLTPAEFAKELRVHPATVRVLCWQGKVPGAVRLGSRWRIDLDAYLEAGKRPPVAANVRVPPAPRSLSVVRLAAARAGL